MSSTRMLWLACVAPFCLSLAGCGEPGGPPLVSAQYPPGTGMVNSHSEPQPIGSLPPGAVNIGAGGPGAVQPNYLSWTFPTP